jgi:hypothetical protein
MHRIITPQIIIYGSIINSLDFTPFIYSHILFVFILSIQVEKSRKINPELILANDLYSDRMGMGRSIILWGFFGIFSILDSAYLAYLPGPQLNTILLLEFIPLKGFFNGRTLKKSTL